KPKFMSSSFSGEASPHHACDCTRNRCWQKGQRSDKSCHSRRMLKRVVLLAPEPVQILDVAGPAEVFGRTARVLRHMGERGDGYSVELLSITRPRSVASSCGLRYVSAGRYRELRGSV